MHSTSQSKGCEGGDAEVFSSLRLAGFDGRCKAILDESRLVLERRTGHTLNMRLESISRMRHHTTPLVPRWLFGVSIFLFYAGWRVFIPPAQFWFLGTGLTLMIAWAVARRPTLTIDSSNGDCHTLFGNDASLMRICALVQRLQDGLSLDEAREGLDFLSREADFPATRSVVDRLTAESEPEPLQANTSIAAILGEVVEDSPEELPPEWLGSTAGSSVVMNSPEHSEVEKEPLAFSRARLAQQQMEMSQPLPQRVADPWAMADVQPFPNNQQTSMIQQPQAQARQGYEQVPQNNGFSMFSEGGLFSAQPTHNQPAPQYLTDRNNGPLGDSMLRDDTQVQPSQKPTSFIPTFLPPLDEDDPDRDLIKVEPGIISAEIIEETTPLVAAAQIDEDRLGEIEEKNVRFPNMKRLMMERTSGRGNRLRRRGDSHSIEEKQGMIGMVIPGLGKLAGASKRLLGRRGGGRSRTTELLRMEAERNRDSQLIEEIKKLTDSADGSVAEEVEKLLETHKRQTVESDVPVRFSDLSSTTDSSAKRVAGLPRLDSGD